MKSYWQRLSAREKGLVLVAALVLLAIVANSLVINPYRERRDWVKTELEMEPQRLDKNLRYLARKDEMAAALVAVRNDLKSREAKLLTGDTPSVSASDLQDVVQALATKEGTQVITTRVLNPEVEGSFSKISIQMEIGAEIDQAANLIRAIETSEKLLIVDEINIRSLFRPVGIPQASRTPPPAASQNLRLSLTVLGFARNHAAAASQTQSMPAPSRSSGGNAS
jgi:type II secretory pathway component PulM